MTLRRMPVIERLDRSALLALGSEWEDLRRESTAVSPFLTWAWIRAWLGTVGRDQDLAIAVARDADTGALIGVAPFYVAATRRRGIALREFRFLGSGVAAPDHLDLIIHNDAAPDLAAALWDVVTARGDWDIVNLDGIATGGHLAAVALRRSNDSAIDLPCPYLPLDGGWDAVSRRFASGTRKNLDRYGRKLDRDASVVERMITSPGDLDDTFDHLVRLHQSIRRANGDPGVFADHDTEDFLREAARRFLEAGRLRMWRLDADEVPIAIILCVRSGDSVAFYTTGYDATWSKYGPGRRVMALAIRGAIDEGASEFDFLRGDEPYKQQWGTKVRTDLVIRRAATTRGRLALGAARVVRFMRELRRGSS
jgi:CelD/BcsL family acetyltransferase involved in cellulose biosynthesis